MSNGPWLLSSTQIRYATLAVLCSLLGRIGVVGIVLVVTVSAKLGELRNPNIAGPARFVTPIHVGTGINSIEVLEVDGDVVGVVA
jgi:hypothetical protein